MARQVPEQYETLGCHFNHVQVFGRCEESNVHNERNRKPEQRTSTIDPGYPNFCVKILNT